MNRSAGNLYTAWASVQMKKVEKRCSGDGSCVLLCVHSMCHLKI